MLPDNQNQTMLTVRLQFSQVLAKDITLIFSIHAEINGQNSTYLNVKLDFCEALLSAQNHFILRKLHHELQRKSSVHLECPLKANVMYEVQNFSIDSKYVLSFFPSVKWMALVKYYYNNKRVLNLEAIGRVDKMK